MERREFLKLVVSGAMCVMPIVAISREEVRRLYDGEVGRCEGFRFIEPQQLPDWPKPEQPKGRQKVNAFIHRRAGHYGF